MMHINIKTNHLLLHYIFEKISVNVYGIFSILSWLLLNPMRIRIRNRKSHVKKSYLSYIRLVSPVLEYGQNIAKELQPVHKTIQVQGTPLIFYSANIYFMQFCKKNNLPVLNLKKIRLWRVVVFQLKKKKDTFWVDLNHPSTRIRIVQEIIFMYILAVNIQLFREMGMGSSESVGSIPF